MSTDLVIINKSLGELEWIIKNYDALFKGKYIDVFLYRVSIDDANLFAPDFFKRNNVRVHEVIKDRKKFNALIAFDNFFDKLSTYIFNRCGKNAQYITDIALIYVKALVSKFLKLEVNIFEVDRVYHENNDRTTCFLEKVISKVQYENLFFYPHHFGETTPKDKINVRLHKLIGVDRCIVNYKNEACFEHYQAVKKNLVVKITRNNSIPTKILILTRQCSDSFGFSYESAYNTLDELLKTIVLLVDVDIYIKNHPRDRDNKYWAVLKEKYSLSELSTSAIDFVSGNNVVCFHLYTTLCEPLSELNIKCFDVSPYKKSLVEKNAALMTQIERQERIGATRRLDKIDSSCIKGILNGIE
ncbi:hypothetical protein NX622_003621 [Vibrio cholerae]|nr:hypothetical protein [Vibrio cholerae]EKF9256126.1 hypothetical protein [Vibrio cholerae]